MQEKEIRFGILIALLTLILLFEISSVSAIDGDLDGDGAVGPGDVVVAQQVESGMTTITDSSIVTDSDTNDDGIINADDINIVQIQSDVVIGSNTIQGDLDNDGAIGPGDVVIAQQASAGLITDPTIMASADVNNDGIVNSADVNSMQTTITAKSETIVEEQEETITQTIQTSSSSGSAEESSGYHSAKPFIANWASRYGLIAKQKAIVEEPIKEIPVSEPVKQVQQTEQNESSNWIWYIIAIVIIGGLCYLGYTYWSEKK